MTVGPPPHHRFSELGGQRIHALDYAGEGPPIVLVHGVTGHAWMWHVVAGLLAPRRHVIAVDLRGHGDSQWSESGEYATDDHVADLAAYLSSLAAPVDLVGSSWGGLAALRLTDRCPGLVRRLALLDAPMRFDQGVDDVPVRPYRFGTIAAVREFERAANPAAPDAAIDACADFGVRPAEHGEFARKHDPVFIDRWPFRDQDHRDELRRCRLPMLLVRGERSPVLTAPEYAEIRASAPEADSIQIPNAGHLIHVEQPTALAAALGTFLGAGAQA